MAEPSLSPELLASPALQLLQDLTELGCHLELTDETVIVEPASRLTSQQQAAVRALAPDLALLVGSWDEGVQRRRAVFERQLAVARDFIPAFVLEPAPPYVRGRCFACGDPLSRPRYGRCWRCALAWRLAAGVPIAADQAPALDDSRVSA